MDRDICPDQEIRVIKRKVLRTLAIAGGAFLALFAYGIYWAFYDLERIPKGDQLAESQSPDGRYIVRVYLSDAGATTSFSTLGELTDNQSGKSRNIYFQYREHEAKVEWLDHDTVVINGRELDVPDENYDYRREASL